MARSRQLTKADILRGDDLVFTPLRPTHRLKLKSKDLEDRSEVGSGWQAPDGSISIQLNPGVVLTYDLKKSFTLVLFPI